MAVEPTLADDGKDPNATIPDNGGTVDQGTMRLPESTRPSSTDSSTPPQEVSTAASSPQNHHDEIPQTMAGPTAIESLGWNSGGKSVVETDLAPPTMALPTEATGPNTRVRPGARGTPTPEPRSNAYWDTIESSGDFQPGQLVFNRYVVEKKLGAGGMGDVWLVKHRDLNTHRALKVIVSRISFDHQARARFKREAQVMAAFHHPNAVVVHDARLTDQDVAYIEMEYVRGDAISDLIRKGEPMPLEWIVRVLDQLCDALSEAHAAGIIHRDLKPANLMMLEGREPGREMLKVLDFGIAKILSESESTESSSEADAPKTMTGAFLGTPFYASPEQAEGDANIDQRSDIYAVGVILYEFLTGFRPFSGSSQRVLVQVLTQPPPSFADVNPNVEYPPGIESLVLRCLAKSPAERPQTARELSQLFQDSIPKPEGPPVKLEPPPPRSLLPVILSLAIAVTLLIGYVILWMRPQEAHKVPALPEGFAAAPNAPVDGVLGMPMILTAVGEAAPLNLRMIVLTGGKFDTGLLTNAHEETVGPFAISEYEVTNGQMRAYFKAKSITPPQKFEQAIADLLKWMDKKEADNHPAVYVPREMAEGFAIWVGGQLPTSVEWEYAARSGGLVDRYYVWEDEMKPGEVKPVHPLKANSGDTNLDCLDSRDTTTAAVGNYKRDKTDQGVYDMMGNVREWCRTDPKYPDGPFSVRGGSFRSDAYKYTNFEGSTLGGKESLDDLGFRVVVELPSYESSVNDLPIKGPQ